MVGSSNIIITSIFFLVRALSIPLNKQHQVSNREKPKETIHLSKTTMIHPSKVPISNIKLKRVLKVYHMLYNDSAGKKTMSKCQREE